MPIEVLNLYCCYEITGTSVGAVGPELKCCPRASPKVFLQRSLISNTIPSLTSGDLGALRGMKLTVINLFRCGDITGTSVGAAGPELKCCPRATPNTLNFRHVSTRRRDHA